MLLKFTKMHGLGNDFVLIDLISQKARLTPSQIRELGDRRTGIGFDQLLLVEPPDNPALDFKYRIFNATGQEVEQCGNGARCFMRFVRDRGLTTKTEIHLETNTGQISCKLEKDGNITVNMGAPVLSPANIPFIASSPQIQYELEICSPTNRTPGASAMLARLPGTVRISAVSLGNPHAVLKVEDVATAPVELLGPIIENHHRFPNRVNVGFMQVVDRKSIVLRVYERGVGETRACGTGACAAVVAGRLQGLLDESVHVLLPGGQLMISWAGDKADVMMTGPASRVYEGRLQL